MNTALITTTIGVPRVLELYRAYGPDVAFFVAGDQKSPHGEIVSFMACLSGNNFYFQPDNQDEWKCSELIGWNCIQRRNIALLEALHAGADIIVTIDDDNMPMSTDYFGDWQIALGKTAGLQLVAMERWIDHSRLLQPSVRHRGLPRNIKPIGMFTRAAINQKVGVATGAVLGDPDIDAIDRISREPYVHSPTERMREGVFMGPFSWTVFNTQNTAFLRKFAPAMFVLPGVGRMDDILASLICQRVMREEGYCVHVGKPFVYQERNAHNLVKDLRAESDWYDRIDEFAQALDDFEFAPKQTDVIDKVRTLYLSDGVQNILPHPTVEAALAWCDDCEEAMK